MTYSLAIGDRTYSSWSLRGWFLFAKFDILVTIETARMYSPEFIEMFYNPKHKHARNGMLSPVEFERQQKMKQEGV
ncbi:MAG: hypothetical protein ABGW81_01540 [Paracoccaceae bacterium]